MNKQQNNHSGNDLTENKDAPFHAPIDVSAVSWDSTPDTAVELINTYGTYEIQPTADTKNEFPAISQGLPSESVKPQPKNFNEGVVPILNDD